MTLETRRDRRTALLAVCLLVLLTAGTAAAQPCLIFAHGKQTNTNTLTNWQAARDYWKSGSRDAIAVATKNFATSYYVIGYNGTDTYWGAGAAGEVEDGADRGEIGQCRPVELVEDREALAGGGVVGHEAGAEFTPAGGVR